MTEIIKELRHKELLIVLERIEKLLRNINNTLETINYGD